MKTFLYIVILCLLGGLLFFIYNPLGIKEVDEAKKSVDKAVSEKAPAVKKTVEAVKSKVSTPTLEKFTYTSTKDGKVDWTLVSDAGIIEDGGNIVDLQGIEITFLSKDGTENHIKAKTGSYNASEDKVLLDGDIVFTNKKGLRMEAVAIDYLISKRIVESTEAVSVHGSKFDIRGVGIKLNVDSGEFEIKEKVTGGFMYGFL